MSRTNSRLLSVLKAIIHEIRAERVTFMAGSIAYNAFLSLLPLLFLLLAVVSALEAQPLELALLSITESIITEGASEILVEELRRASPSLSILGLAVLVWSALRIFRSLDMAFSDIYESQAENTLTNQIFDGLVVLVSVSLVVLSALFVESQVAVDIGLTFGWVFQRLLLFAVLSLALFPMFYLFPDESDMQLVEAVPGVLFSAAGLLVLQSLFGLYLAFSNPQAQNSVLASIIVFLTWLYFNALVILIGAAINAVLTNRSRQVQIEPVLGGNPTQNTDRRSSRAVPASTLARLSSDLPTAQTLAITVDGTRSELPPPERVDADVDTSPLPFVNDTVHITLHWSPDDSTPERHPRK